MSDQPSKNVELLAMERKKQLALARQAITRSRQLIAGSKEAVQRSKEAQEHTQSIREMLAARKAA